MIASERNAWTPVPMTRPDLPIEQQVRLHAQSRPHDLAIVAAGNRWTWQELDIHSDRLAAGLQERGLRAGERIAWSGRNEAWQPALMIACLRTGIVPVGINWRLTSAELTPILKLVGPRLLVARVSFASETGLNRIEPERLAREARYDHLSTVASPKEDDRPAAIFLTSGSTGAPKARMLRRNALHARLCAPNALDLDGDARLLIAAPFFHVAGWAWTLFALAGGLRQIVASHTEPAGLLDLIASEGVTHAQWLPSMLEALLREQSEKPRDTSSLRMVAYGAGAVERETLNAAQATFDTGFCQVYGLTETAAAIGHLDAEVHRRRRNHTQLPTTFPDPDIAITITDGEGLLLPQGQIGEVRIADRQPPVEGLTPDGPICLLDQQGRIPTGDLGWIDEEGFLHLVGRADEIIITGGENVHPGEVEEVLNKSAMVAEACVFSLHDKEWGEKICAAIVPHGDVVDTRALTDFCREHLAGFKVPRTYVIVRELPRTATGKVRRKELASLVTGTQTVETS